MEINQERYDVATVSSKEIFLAKAIPEEQALLATEVIRGNLSEDSLVARVILESAMKGHAWSHPFYTITFTLLDGTNLKAKLVPDLHGGWVREQTSCCNEDTEFTWIGREGIYTCKRCGRVHLYKNFFNMNFSFNDDESLVKSSENQTESSELYRGLQDRFEKLELDPFLSILTVNEIVETIEQLVRNNPQADNR